MKSGFMALQLGYLQKTTVRATALVVGEVRRSTACREW
jgi:hypothetical protein